MENDLHGLDALLEEAEDRSGGFHVLLRSHAWRAALLNGEPGADPRPVDSMQKHDRTDEAFLLLGGRCILVVADGQDAPEHIYCRSMFPLRLYTVKRHVWHAVVRSQDCSVLIIENDDTADDNSPRIPLTKEQILLVQQILDKA